MVSQSVATRRYTLILVSAFTAVGLLLAAVGVYGVISYATSQRAREFGIRIALGATRGRVISYVLRGSVVLTALGSLIGVFGAMFLSRLFSSLLFEISPLDILSFSASRPRTGTGIQFKRSPRFLTTRSPCLLFRCNRIQGGHPLNMPKCAKVLPRHENVISSNNKSEVAQRVCRIFNSAAGRCLCANFSLMNI